jgi:hypothetical protein
MSHASPHSMLVAVKPAAEAVKSHRVEKTRVSQPEREAMLWLLVQDNVAIVHAEPAEQSLKAITSDQASCGFPRESLPRRAATISARIEIAISSGVMAPRSRPAGALSLASRSGVTPRSASAAFRAGWQASHWMMPRISLAARIKCRTEFSEGTGAKSASNQRVKTSVKRANTSGIALLLPCGCLGSELHAASDAAIKALAASPPCSTLCFGT